MSTSNHRSATCDFCGLAEHFGACPELLAFTERLAIHRHCPHCGATMERCERAYVCPTARTEAKVVTVAARQQVRATAAERVEFAPF